MACRLPRGCYRDNVSFMRGMPRQAAFMLCQILHEATSSNPWLSQISDSWAVARTPCLVRRNGIFSGKRCETSDFPRYYFLHASYFYCYISLQPASPCGRKNAKAHNSSGIPMTQRQR
jgi:hypothetical protein